MCPIGVRWERTLQSWHLVSFDSTSLPFRSADFALCLFAIMNHIYKCDYMLNPVSSLSELLNLGVVLGTHHHTDLFRFSISS